MSIIVNGGARFIGSNFVLDWLAQSDEPVIALDKLPHVGSKRARHDWLTLNAARS